MTASACPTPWPSPNIFASWRRGAPFGLATFAPEMPAAFAALPMNLVKRWPVANVYLPPSSSSIAQAREIGWEEIAAYP